MGNVYLWNTTNLIKLTENIKENIIKLASIDNHLFVLTYSNVLYHGYVEKVEKQFQLNLLKYTEHNVQDIDSCGAFLYIVDTSGRVFKLTEDLRTSTEITLTIEPKCCPHGHCDTENNLKVCNISVGNYGILFITTCGQLWGSGNMPQIGICSIEPKKVTLFSGRTILDISVGSDFAVALLCKQVKSDDTDSDEGEEDVFVSTCPRCISLNQISTPSSQNSLNELGQIGPLEISTSVLSSSKTTESSDSEQTKKFVTCPSQNENGNEKSEKNIIFRNTEAAKEFLTRQFSWVSAAGEEYLAECTEKPTRIIKENVSNMANLVYEGVKTVGDKVVTLSRHVSGSSDTTEALESLDLSLNSSKDDCLLSSSQCTSEKEFVEQALQERCNSIYKAGTNLLGTELWTWGNVSYGQLGIGDTVRRDKPIMLNKLSYIGVQKVHVKNFHTAVLTLDGRVFLWGCNQYHQVTVDTKVDISAPRLFVLNSDTGDRIKDTGDRITDVSCGEHHTVILTSRNNLYYMGKLLEGCTDKVVQILPNIALETENLLEVKSSFSKKIRKKLMTSSMYTVYNFRYNLDNPLLEDIALEQIYLEELLTVQSFLIKPLQRKNFNSPDLNVYETLLRNYSEVVNFTAAILSSLIDFCTGNAPMSEVILIKHSEEHLFMYRNYLKTICNVISIGGFVYLSSLIDIQSQLYKISMQSYSKRDSKSAENVIHWLFTHALRRLSIYCLIIQKLLRNISEDQKLLDIKQKWDIFILEQETKQTEAELTKKFWDNSLKSLDDLKSPERRLTIDSRVTQLQLYGASRFSNHTFILLSDVFIHVNGSSPMVHSLLTLWVELLPDTDNLQNALMLTMPEETLTLYANRPEHKGEWYHALTNALKVNLNKSSVDLKKSHQPFLIRTASYTFTKNAAYKDAKYTGRWSNGKMHGNGRLEWPDGKMYVGQFQFNQMSGFGKLENPTVGIYEGGWKDNLQHGRGIMKYTNGDVYEGYFKDGLPYGHGMRKQGHHMGPGASVHIGEWLSGIKFGYGVMDDISTGEKYLGNWSDNKKHGGGLIVTSNPMMYYEGVFNQDVLTGPGLMIFEDNAHYEGEFKAAGKFSGKGVLTLSSGDKIEGSLSGSWNEGIKISAGTLHLSMNKEAIKTPKSFGKFCVDGNLKWKAIFRLCYQTLGIPTENSSKNNNKILDTTRAWNNVAVFISNSRFEMHRSDNKKNRKQIRQEQLDLIPQFCRESIDSKSFKELRHYLMKAFEVDHHPIGLLLTDLTEAYTATYGGLIVNPLLLTHAVNELHSIIVRVYEIVRVLFPALPEYGKEINLSEDDESDVVSCAAVLHPFILPKVYSAIFTLYTLHNKSEDNIYWKRLTEWYKQSDFTLMAFLNVHQKFWSCANTQEPYSPMKDQIFTKAVETLQQLKTTFSPFEKLLVIRETFQNMTIVAKAQLHPEYGWTMDDLLPAFLFVVVRARILQLGSEIQFMEDFMEPHLKNGEFGIMFTTLQACYHQILEEKSTIN